MRCNCKLLFSSTLVMAKNLTPTTQLVGCQTVQVNKARGLALLQKPAHRVDTYALVH